MSELSREYNEKLKETGDEFYRSKLQKIAALSLMAIPEVSKTKKSGKKKKIFLYFFVGSLTFQLITSLMLEPFSRFRLPALIILLLVFYYMRTHNKTKDNKEGW